MKTLNFKLKNLNKTKQIRSIKVLLDYWEKNIRLENLKIGNILNWRTPELENLINSKVLELDNLEVKKLEKDPDKVKDSKT